MPSEERRESFSTSFTADYTEHVHLVGVNYYWFLCISHGSFYGCDFISHIMQTVLGGWGEGGRSDQS